MEHRAQRSTVPTRTISPDHLSDRATVTTRERHTTVNNSRLADVEEKLEGLSSELAISHKGTTRWRMISFGITVVLVALATVAMFLPLGPDMDPLVALKDEVDGLRDNVERVLPLGSIIAWVPHPQKGAKPEKKLPSGWLPCDGSLITNGVWKGKSTPAINNKGYFLRGGTEGQALTPEGDQIARHTHTYSRATHSYSPGNICSSGGTCGDPDNLEVSSVNTNENTGGSETRPKNMRVVYAIKCW